MLSVTNLTAVAGAALLTMVTLPDSPTQEPQPALTITTNPDDFEVKTTMLRIYEGDASQCKKFDIRNVTDPGPSKQEVVVTWSDNNQTSAEIEPPQHIIRECTIKAIDVKELNLQVSTVRLSEIK